MLFIFYVGVMYVFGYRSSFQVLVGHMMAKVFSTVVTPPLSK